MITAMPRIAIAVNDFSATVETFRDKLGMPVIDMSEGSVNSLGAKLAMCVPKGGSNIELMCPAVPDAPLSQSLQRFLDRRGEGLFALMLEAPDPDAEADDLLGRGLNVLPLMAGAGGRDVHPNSTHGVLIRVYPVNSFQGQEPDRDAYSDLSGIERVIIAVHDMDHAIHVYGDQFAMDIGEPMVDASKGVRSAICNPPSGGVIELVTVEDSKQPFGKSIEGFLRDKREGMYALVLRSNDPKGVAKILSSRGLKVGQSDDSEAVMEIDRESTFGALLRIEPTT
jgi:catechol 2,3-dioxygenase-like lactoylglutathione lyase family enzyme|tara:strand:- start:11985 stop:12830 length:846 start_codon:yes stop_codon:yes gene_type:complete